MSSSAGLSLPEWVVLAVIDEAPAHGFAVASLTSAEGFLGQVWQIPRPVVYRSLGRLEDAGLVVVDSVERGKGPQRHVYRATPAGARQVRRWLRTPVQHVRDIRSHLLLKLALLARRDEDPSSLLEDQRRVLDPILTALAGQRERATGFDATIVAWRRANALAAAAFLEDVAGQRVGG